MLVAAVLLCGAGVAVAIDRRRRRRRGPHAATTAIALHRAPPATTSTTSSAVHGSRAHRTKHETGDGGAVYLSMEESHQESASTAPPKSSRSATAATLAAAETSTAAEFASLRLSLAPGSSATAGMGGGRGGASSSGLPLLLGQGGFCRVYEARWGGELCAVKVPLDLSSAGAASLSAEARVLRALRHPCVCAFFGCCRLTLPHEGAPRLALVMEHMAGGTLHQLLSFPSDGAHAADADTSAATAATARPSGTDGPPPTPTPPQAPPRRRPLPALSLRLRLAGNVADALAFLHAKGLVHRDVKGSNVLLDATRSHAKLADFGLSKILSDARSSGSGNGNGGEASPSSGEASHRCGTLRYLAPEAIHGRSVGTPVDVYAFALLLHELTHGVKALAPLAPLQAAIAAASHGARPALTLPAAQGGAWLCPLLERCWSADPLARPPMSEVVDALLVEVGSFSPEDAQARGPASAGGGGGDGGDGDDSSPSSVTPSFCSACSHHSAKAAGAAFVAELSASVAEHKEPPTARPPSSHGTAAAHNHASPPAGSTHEPHPHVPSPPAQETGSNSATPNDERP